MIFLLYCKSFFFFFFNMLLVDTEARAPHAMQSLMSESLRGGEFAKS